MVACSILALSSCEWRVFVGPLASGLCSSCFPSLAMGALPSEPEAVCCHSLPDIASLQRALRYRGGHRPCFAHVLRRCAESVSCLSLCVLVLVWFEPARSFTSPPRLALVLAVSCCFIQCDRACARVLCFARPALSCTSWRCCVSPVRPLLPCCTSLCPISLLS